MHRNPYLEPPPSIFSLARESRVNRNGGGAILAEYSENCSCLYPALGRADARNEGGGAKLSPPCDPPSGKDFLRKLFLQWRFHPPTKLGPGDGKY